MEIGLLHILLFFMIVGALIAVETKNLLSAIISVGAVGFLLSIAFLILGAPDIAITQIVVEILCLVILIRATISRDLTAISGDREFFGTIVTVTMVIVVTIVGLNIFIDFPAFGSSVLDRFVDAPSRSYLATGLSKTGAPNIVTAILLDFRAYDTLGEATVLFCAIVGALTILRRKARKEINEPDSKDEDKSKEQT
jgi:multisubunit Na+/H+ antiporter MnhB subunit